jgi:hypothetical protein
VGDLAVSIPGIEIRPRPTAIPVTRRALLCPALCLFVACVPEAPAGTCFVDAHCGDGLACIEGFCGMPMETSSADSDDSLGDLKLDIGGGASEIPASCTEAMGVRTNAGCEFYAVDLPNGWLPAEPFSHDIAADQQFAVVVANVSDSETAEVEVFSGSGTSPIMTVTVGPLDTETLALPKQSVDPTSNGKTDAFRITSDTPITAYQFQPLDNLVPVYSNDASALLPAHVLENDYIAVTANALNLHMYPPGSYDYEVYSAGAFVTAVATEDGTQVTFYPTAGLAPGAYEDVVLDRGESFTILSDTNDDSGHPAGNLSGTRVLADAPIAVFSGNVSAIEPVDATECCADHVEHQMLPLVAWGASYIAAPPPLPGNAADDAPASYRITAAFDGTQLEYSGTTPDGAPTSLDANETAVFTTNDALMVRSDAEHPFAVTQFLLSSGENPGGGIAGDPAMIAQPSLSQLQTRYVFLTPAGYRESVVVIYTREGTDVAVDGEEIESWRSMGSHDGDEWVFARVPLVPGAHVLIADDEAGIDVYGYDNYVSYAYAGGSAVDRISEAPPIP